MTWESAFNLVARDLAALDIFEQSNPDRKRHNADKKK
jgi:hypothetical protein